MKIALIGTNWGRIHIGSLRNLGLDVDLIIGRDKAKTKEIAKQENIANASTNLDAINDHELIIVASNAESHLAIIERFPNKAIWCEKPVSLEKVDSKSLDFRRFSKCYMNYAFPFLDSMQIITDILRRGEIGRAQSVVLKVGFNLSGKRSLNDWFTDIAVHPISFLSHLFGDFDLKMAFQMPDHNHISAIFANKQVQMDVSFFRRHENSMLFDIFIVGEKGEIQCRGGYKPYSQWYFEPVKLNGIPQNAGEYSKEQDIWLKANTDALQCYLHFLNGKISKSDAKAAGLFNLKRAISMESALISLHKKGKLK